jgi:hypothetical protein
MVGRGEMTYVDEQRCALSAVFGDIVKHDRAACEVSVWTGESEDDILTSSRYTKYSHFPRISTKCFNMILHPLQRELLVKQPCVDDAAPGHLFAGKEAKSSELCLRKYFHEVKSKDDLHGTEY